MKRIKILQHSQQSATFLNAIFSGKHWKLLQVYVTENEKFYVIYYITTYLLYAFFIFLFAIFLNLVVSFIKTNEINYNTTGFLKN